MADLKEKIRILMVDDDEEDFIITKDILSNIVNQKYSIEWIPNFEKAEDEIQKDYYDLFLLDYNLGEKSGLDLLNEIMRKNKNIPVIMLTGQNNREIDILAMKNGACDYLVKGKVDPDLMERSIRYAIDKKAKENQIMYLAYYDQLTNLPNRVFFKEQLNYALSHAIRYKRMLAVLFLDLDNFKVINDSLGHYIGDLLLNEVAKRLFSSVRKGDIISRNSLKTSIDTVARLGGDEFSISLTEINTYEDASIVANRIINSINEPFNIENHEIFSGVSIGISLCPLDSVDAEILLKYADNAMYFTKKHGKNNFEYYQKSMNINVNEKMNMIRKIRKAVDQNEFILYYQPKMKLQTGEITGFEALIRWNQDGEKIISPINFIPFAEENNLISFITDWVIHNICEQFNKWQQIKIPVLPISINLPINQFKKPDFVEYLSKITSSNNVAPKLIELEVTESIFMDDMMSTNLKLNELQALGYRISIDDFGTGFSSLNRLKEIPCNILKIDKSFIDHIHKKDSNDIIIQSIITMGHGLNMEILAEGVENEEQLYFLKKNNCDTIQGYLLSRPFPVEKAEDLLIKEKNGMGIGLQLIKKE